MYEQRLSINFLVLLETELEKWCVDGEGGEKTKEIHARECDRKKKLREKETKKNKSCIVIN